MNIIDDETEKARARELTAGVIAEFPHVPESEAQAFGDKEAARERRLTRCGQHTEQQITRLKELVKEEPVAARALDLLLSVCILEEWRLLICDVAPTKGTWQSVLQAHELLPGDEFVALARTNFAREGLN